MQGNADFDDGHTCVGIKVSHKNRLHAAKGANTRTQVYIGVCPSTDYASTNWSAEVAAHGVPPWCIAWGMGQDCIVINSGETRESYPLQPEGCTYAADATVCMRVGQGLVEFYVEEGRTQCHVASVMFTDATLRPFVAVRGQEYQCTLVKASIRPKFYAKNLFVETGKPCLCMCVLCVYTSM
jgi:hypothetical protein